MDTLPKKKPGRPKGSKNKKEKNASKQKAHSISGADLTELIENICIVKALLLTATTLLTKTLEG